MINVDLDTIFIQLPKFIIFHQVSIQSDIYDLRLSFYPTLPMCDPYCFCSVGERGSLRVHLACIISVIPHRHLRSNCELE